MAEEERRDLAMNDFKEFPMLFSTEMVNATIRGTKTETRRTRGLEIINKNPNDWAFANLSEGYPQAIFNFINRSTGEFQEVKFPYGRRHTHIWIRETWAELDFLAHDQVGVVFKASEIGQDWSENDEAWTWKPSIHMPKKFARIWLQIEQIGVERLKDISKTSAIAEGIEVKEDDIQFSYKDYLSDEIYYYDPINSFQSLWESINGEDSWTFNPWVWVIKFSKVKS